MEIVLGRVGHYFDAGNGSCSTALIVQVHEGATSINVAGWHHGGDQFSRTSVPVNATPGPDDSQSSFHLTRECPWSR